MARYATQCTADRMRSVAALHRRPASVRRQRYRGHRPALRQRQRRLRARRRVRRDRGIGDVFQVLRHRLGLPGPSCGFRLDAGAGQRPECATDLLQGTVTSTAYPLCTVACNPVSAAGPSGCLAHQLCVYTVTPSGVDTTDCQGSYAGIEGNACSVSTDCDVGLVCVGRAQTHCRQVCRIGLNSDCTVAGDTCMTPAGATAPMFGYCCPAGGC